MTSSIKHIALLLASLAFAAVLGGCVKEQPAPEKQRELVTITASVSGEPLTKVAFDDAEEGDGLALSWEDGDCLMVISGSESGQYDIVDDYTEHVARFRGPEVTGSKYTIIYPGEYESVAEAEAFDFANQIQNGNDDKSHLRYLAVLQDVDTKDDIVFKSDWAVAHGGTFKQSGVVKFVLTLPNAVTSVSKIKLTGLDTPIAISLKNVKLSSTHTVTAYAVTPWADQPIAAGTNLKFTITAGDGGTWVRTVTISGATAIKAGVQSIFRLTKGFEESLFAGGTGVEGDPYLIESARHLYNMHEDGVMEPWTKTWFKMIADVDMSAISEEWIPLNYDNPYRCEVDFDGGGHTISNFVCNRSDESGPGFFRVLFGDVHDVSFANASVTNTAPNPTGILASYGGYAGMFSRVWNVHIQGTVVNNHTDKSSNGTGGMFGRINTIDIESSSVDCTITTKRDYTGLIFGYDTGYSVIRNCWTSGTVNGGGKTGGIGGGFIKSETSVYNCYSVAKVNGSFQAGGILGHANLDDKSNNATNQPGNHVEGCIAWNDWVHSTSTDSNEHYSSGAIVGYTATHNYLADCYRRADLDFSECPGNVSRGYGLTNQENASPSSPMSRGSNTYDFAYHGKAASSSSLSQVASSLGWSSNVWDFSGSIPTLTGEVEFFEFDAESGAVNAPTGSNPKPGQGEIRPSAGNGWTITNVNDAIKLYSYAGTPPETGKIARVFVIDYDLSNPNYKLKFVRADPSATNSSVFAANNALASINGGYELGSIVFKADNIGYSYMPNNEISWTSDRTSDKGTVYKTPNWKSEAAFYYNNNNDLQIRFDGYGLSVSEQRKFYLFNTGEWSNIVSSTPMLINDWYPSGTVFVNPVPTSSEMNTLSHEDARYHQTMTHPRTAIAITEGRHFLMITVDGRQSQAVGMSAKQLTNFLVNYFNPRWALNLDGGGSTTMCVRHNNFKADNYVVNCPVNDGSDNTHTGERQVSSHICIVNAN